MALDVTIGGIASDSYVTLAEFQTYWTARGVDLTQHGHDDSHEANLRVAAQYIDGKPYAGRTEFSTQARAWPRVTTAMINGWPIEAGTIPQAVKDAQCEMAYLVHEGATPFATFEGGVSSESASAGPVSTSKTFSGTKGRPQYTAVDMLLRGLMGAGAGQVRLVRA